MKGNVCNLLRKHSPLGSTKTPKNESLERDWRVKTLDQEVLII